jgi:hypothetical protein
MGDVDWIHLAKDRDQWRTVMNTLMNFHKFYIHLLNPLTDCNETSYTAYLFIGH